MPDPQPRLMPEGVPARITLAIVIAGLLGGLLGGVVSFAANRFIKPAEPAAAHEPSQAHGSSTKEEAAAEAQQIVEKLLAILKQGPLHHDEFMKAIKSAYTYMPDNDFAVFRQGFDDGRIKFEGWFGKSLLEFELLHRIALNSSLIEFIYLEKYEHGSINWRFILYRGKERWFIAWVTWTQNARDAFLP